MTDQKHVPQIESLEALNNLMTSLLQSLGVVGRWEHLEGSTEGKSLPGGIQSESGTILTQDGRIFTFWLGWNPNKIAPDGTLGWYDLGEDNFYESEGRKHSYFEEVLPDQGDYPKPTDTSYLTARRKLGLSLTDEQMAILKDYGKRSPTLRKELGLE